MRELFVNGKEIYEIYKGFSNTKKKSKSPITCQESVGYANGVYKIEACM